MTPLLYPAIDLLEGRAVRLHKGERGRIRPEVAYSAISLELNLRRKGGLSNERKAG